MMCVDCVLGRPRKRHQDEVSAWVHGVELGTDSDSEAEVGEWGHGICNTCLCGGGGAAH